MEYLFFEFISEHLVIPAWQMGAYIIFVGAFMLARDYELLMIGTAFEEWPPRIEEFPKLPPVRPLSRAVGSARPHKPAARPSFWGSNIR